jgi:hypothetical protein
MFNMFKKQGTSQRSASTTTIGGDIKPGFVATPTGEQAMACWACEELELDEMDEVQLATVVGGDVRLASKDVKGIVNAFIFLQSAGEEYVEVEL